MVFLQRCERDLEILRAYKETFSLLKFQNSFTFTRDTDRRIAVFRILNDLRELRIAYSTHKASLYSEYIGLSTVGIINKVKRTNAWRKQSRTYG